ncbi:MAG: DHHA1 domain-containing protein, partial [Bacteroidales bacterium]|nr:DHHA1 domain-containing protein [Bacteroidales bacterium]
IENLFKKADVILSDALNDHISLAFDHALNQSFIGSYQDVINKRHLLSEVQVRVKDLEKEYTRKKEELALNDLTPFLMMVENDTLVGKVENVDLSVLKQIVDNLLVKIQKGTVLLASIVGEKVVFLAKTNKAGVHAGNLVKNAAILCGGNGGGRPDFAQAGGRDITKVEQALRVAKESLL